MTAAPAGWCFYSLNASGASSVRSGIFIEDPPPNFFVFSGGAIPTPTHIGPTCRAAGKDELQLLPIFL